MKRQGIIVQASLPEDVAINIISRLEVSDVCSLGSCSKFWRETCGSEYLWKYLCQVRWSGVVLEDDDEEEEEAAETHDHDDHVKAPTLKGWRGLYVKKHTDMAEKAACVKNCLSCAEIDVNLFRKTIEDMKLVRFGFKDVQIFFLKPRINVLLNLVGLHYCIKELGVQVDSMVKALKSCGIQERQVYLQWWETGNWLHRFRPPDVLHARCIPLEDFTISEGVRVLGMLERGITPDVLRIEIYAAEPHNKLTPARICTKCKRLKAY